MKKNILLLILISSFSSVLFAENYEWVQPGTYEMGTCAGYGGSHFPGYNSTKYYDQYSCNQAYAEGDKCYTEVMHLQNQMSQEQLAQCGSWLISELSNCRSFMRSAAYQCSNLAQ